MTISSIGRRVALVGSLAMLVALLPLAASAQPTGPVLRDLQVNDELEASESVQASILWSQEAFADDSADEVLIATDADFADALASGVLQGDAPLLYTDGDSVDDLVLEEIERLGATSATILGGEVAVSSDVEDALTDAGLEVSRLEGESRIETAVAIAEQELEGDTVFLARAFGTETDPTQAFADNLALGGWAADSGIPVLLTQTDVLTGNTRAFLEANTDVTNVTVVGGEAAISEDVVAELEELGLTVERVEGENRFGTAVAIAEARGLAAADVDQAVFVEGQADDAYINGLAAAAYSAANDAPILLTNGDSVPPETQDYLGDEADFSITDEPGETAGVLGTNVSADAAQALADALNAELETVMLPGPTPPTNQTFTVTADATQVPVGSEVHFTAEVGDAEEVTVFLIEADSVTRDNGNVTFEDVDLDGNLVIAPAAANITEVDGVAVPANPQREVQVGEGGTVEFTVLAGAAESFVALVAETDDAGDVAIGEDGAPTGGFGVSEDVNVQDVLGIALYDADKEDLLIDGLTRPAGETVNVEARLLDDTIANDGATATVDGEIFYLVANAVYAPGTDPGVVPGNQVVASGTVAVEDGVATFSFEGGDNGQTYSILARWTAAEGSAYEGLTRNTLVAPAAHGQVTFSSADPVATTATFVDASDQLVELNGTATVAVEVVDQYDNPVVGADVDFDVNGAPAVTRVTNPQGIATYAFSNDTNGLDVVTADVVAPAIVVQPAAGVNVYWYEEATTDAAASQVVAVDTEADTILVQEAGPTFFLYSYGDADVLQVNGTISSLTAFEARLEAAEAVNDGFTNDDLTTTDYGSDTNPTVIDFGTDN